MLTGKTIVLGVTGGIAAFKAASLCSKLVQKGADVHVIMTESAKQFITELTFQSLSKNPVYSDTFDERDPSVVSHIHLADEADLVLIAPATANMIAKMAHGLADDMLSTTLLATEAPVMIAPAMNVHMYAHPAVQANMRLLESRGVMMIEPGEGLLACGYVGKGRLEEPETIVQVVERFLRLAMNPYKGRVCSAGKRSSSPQAERLNGSTRCVTSPMILPGKWGLPSPRPPKTWARRCMSFTAIRTLSPLRTWTR